MTRARALTMLAVGCVLAALAAGTGAFLVPSERVPPLRRLLRGRGFQPLRPQRRDAGGVPSGLAHWLDVAVGTVVLLLATAVLAYALWYLARALVRIARLRFATSGERRPTGEYDAGDESADDAETALRRRVREELTALSGDLDTWPDAREAVVACYVRMERALAEAGSPRYATESPRELVARVLAEQQVPEADIRRLTDLFGEARFSRHPVTDEMRAAARRSLDAVAASLRAYA